MRFDLSTITSVAPFLMSGLLFTLQITIVGVAGGIVFGSLLAVARLSRNRLLSAFATAMATSSVNEARRASVSAGSGCSSTTLTEPASIAARATEWSCD